jgi:opacity protein-like surface antigen
MNSSNFFYTQSLTISVFLTIITSFSAQADWFVRPFVGLSQMSDLTVKATDIDSLSGDAQIKLDSGFNAGLGVGYQYSNNLAVELAWEYRSNGSETTIDEQSVFNEGNYASNMFFVNGFYYFDEVNNWSPYLGAGLSWIQEVDIDLERDGIEQSYSGSSDTGYQIFAGVDYQLTPEWLVQFELRYGSVTDIALDGEEGATGSFDNFDYQTTTSQLGIVYRF